MEDSGNKHTFSIHTPFRARGTQAGPRTLGKAEGPAPAAEAGDAGLTGAQDSGAITVMLPPVATGPEAIWRPGVVLYMRPPR